MFCKFDLNMAKYTRQFTTEHPPELQWVPGVIESSAERNKNNVTLFSGAWWQSISNPHFFKNINMFMFTPLLQFRWHTCQTFLESPKTSRSIKIVQIAEAKPLHNPLNITKKVFSHANIKMERDEHLNTLFEAKSNKVCVRSGVQLFWYKVVSIQVVLIQGEVDLLHM